MIAHPPRLMLLTTVRSYRMEAFRAAAERLGIAVATGLDLPPELADQWPEALPLPFAAPDEAAAGIAAYAAEHPLAAILSVDDSGSLVAAAASRALGLPHNDPAAAVAARDKFVMRRLLREGGVPTPWFERFTTADDPAAVAVRAPYPCVVKPLNLNGSRGVIRADSPAELVAAIDRLTRLIAPPPPRPPTPPPPASYLVEAFIPGFEVALEGLLDDGQLRVLALFDKPDPLDGPFFEETIYVTPSRLPEATQVAIAATTAAAARTLGLWVGPVHAELRVNEAGVWLIEVAGRSIGGLCSQVLRFGIDASLEELILRQAVGLPLGDVGQRDRAAGVMMIPIPQAGLLRAVEGVDEATAVPLIDGVEITARLHYPLTPLPEGDSYLGFIFARGETPAEVEAALRQAHGRLRFAIDPLLTVL
ncbi:MAG: ATP-grasp domain-containing protein [Candidatus Promineofilum sp.]|nr:ATP-grasp domain-containing protein [Promineifilum sp.]MCW5862653.1 ATP-grasp domain-containing protein [Anaerolineae bacterium]